MTPPVTRPRVGRLTLALMLAAVVLALLMGGLLVFELNQRQALIERQRQRVDSITAPAFLLDREVLRFGAALHAWTQETPHPALDAVQLRLDILLSKISVLRDSHGSAALLDEPAAAEALRELVAATQQADQLLLAPQADVEALHALAARFDQLSVSSQTLGNQADLISSKLLESQTNALLRQNTQIVWLTVAQLSLLLVAIVGLLWRHRNQQREQQALRELNQALRSAQIEAERANRGKSVFLANMSHELRTPFNGIMGWLDILDQSPMQADQREWVATIRRSANHLLHLLNDILDMSALEAGKIKVRPTPTNINALLREVETLMQPLAKTKQLALELSIELPSPTWIALDPTRLRQILINLTNNAIKFTEHGQVRIHAYTQRPATDSSDPALLMVEVCDTGMGIGEHELQQLFQRFHQLDDDLSRRHGGTGLGLQISLALARLMGGDIQVQSMAGRGSTFTLRLPAHAVPAPSTSTPDTQEQHATDRLRVLVAEDNVVNQQFIKAVLSRLQCDVMVCDNGAQALHAAQCHPFDVVLMDIHMPEMDGLAATAAIRALPPPMRDVPIYALTADVFEDTREKALRVGINRMLTKPVQLKTLRDALAEIQAQRLAR